MDGFGDLLGSLGDAFGGLFGEAGAEGTMGIMELFSPDGRRGAGEERAFIVYERYLCGGPRTLHINDR